MSDGETEIKTLDLPDRPDAELRQLALDINAGMAFTDRHCKDASALGMVFMPLALGAFAGLADGEIEKIGLIYEYYDKAGPRSVNGYPSFFSMQMLNRDDTEKVLEYGRNLSARDKEFVEGNDGSQEEQTTEH
jgi:hypothetical protein